MKWIDIKKKLPKMINGESEPVLVYNAENDIFSVLYLSEFGKDYMWFGVEDGSEYFEFASFWCELNKPV